MPGVGDWIQIGLTVVLLIVSLSRWTKERETSTAELDRRVKRLEDGAEGVNDWITSRGSILDSVYVRKDYFEAKCSALDERINSANAGRGGHR
jgi:hypothetical protein